MPGPEEHLLRVQEGRTAEAAAGQDAGDQAEREADAGKEGEGGEGQGERGPEGEGGMLSCWSGISVNKGRFGSIPFGFLDLFCNNSEQD